MTTIDNYCLLWLATATLNEEKRGEETDIQGSGIGEEEGVRESMRLTSYVFKTPGNEDLKASLS
jgi:hypothetical protein